MIAPKHDIIFFFLLLFMGLMGQSKAQNVDDDSVVKSVARLASPQVLPDNRVVFRYYAPDARRVVLKSTCLRGKPDKSWFGGKTGRVRMRKDSTGVWSHTTDSLSPGVYNYRFVVDGKFVHDPLNPDSAYVLLHQESLVSVGGDFYANFCLEPQQGVPRGRIDTLVYYNEAQGVNRRVMVYVPQADSCQGPFSVLYLFHGISGDEAAWSEEGKVAQILDNLISQGMTERMIVVMPDCNVKRKLEPKRRTNLLRNMLNYPALQRRDFEKAFPGLHCFLCSRYCISDQKRHHYIAGLSSGAKQAANIVRDNPELFSVVGLFSPVLGKKQIPHEVDSTRFEVFVGEDDLFYKNGLRYASRLTAAGVECDLKDIGGSHDWRSWRLYLMLFLLDLGD